MYEQCVIVIYIDYTCVVHVRVHVEIRSKRELWVKPSLNSIKEEEEGMLAKG
jgi:hypothetical protein